MSYWMIEHFDYPSGHNWLRIAVNGSVNGIPRGELMWTEHPQAAMHFARQEDAEHFAFLHPEWCVLAKVTGHTDLDGVGVPHLSGCDAAQQEGEKK